MDALKMLPAFTHAPEVNRVYQVDAMTLLKAMPDESVNCIVTSPPYFGLRDYGVSGQIGLERTPAEYVARLVALFHEARRVLRDNGTFWLNLGDSYVSKPVGSFNGGSELLKGRNLTGHAQSGGMDKTTFGIAEKNLIGIPWRVAFGLQDDGWILRSDIIWAKPNPMPESVTDRPTKAHEYVFLFAKSARYFYDADAIREPAVYGENRATYIGGTERLRKANVVSGGFIPSDKGRERPITENRNKRSVWTVATEPTPFAHFATYPQKLIEPCILAGCPNRVCAVCGAPWVRVVEIEGETARQKIAKRGESEYYKANGNGLNYAGGHGNNTRQRETLGFEPTCDCHADTRPGLVFDPFMGSGTTARVAFRWGRQFMGSEINPEYVAIHDTLIRQVTPDMFAALEAA
jgi:DNA modification methylase